MFIAGVGEGDARGVGEGMFIPGMFIAGVGEGDARGVSEGIGIECPGCCADAEAAFASTNDTNATIDEITRNPRTNRSSCSLV